MNIRHKINGTEQSRRILLVAHAPHAFGVLVPLATALEKRGYDCRLFCNRQDSMNVNIHEQSAGFVVHQMDSASEHGFLPALAKSIPFFSKEVVTHWQMRNHCRRLIALHQPAAVLFTSDTTFPDASLVRVANELNIPTILIHWAFTLPQGYSDDLTRGVEKIEHRDDRNVGVNFRSLYRATRRMVNPWLRDRLRLSFQFAHTYGGGEARRFAVMGEGYVDMFAHKGVPREKMIVTGNPEHDALYYRRLSGNTLAAKHRVCSELGLPFGPLVVFTTQPLVKEGLLSAAEYRRETSILVESVLEINNCTLVVKIHPKEELHDYAFVNEYGSRVTVCKEYDLITLVEACDVFVSRHSTTILMAMGWGKPIVTFSFSSANYFAELGGTLHVTKPGDLPNALLSVLRNEQVKERLVAEQQQFVSRYMKFDGKVVERIISLIEAEIYKG